MTLNPWSDGAACGAAPSDPGKSPLSPRVRPTWLVLLRGVIQPQWTVSLDQQSVPLVVTLDASPGVTLSAAKGLSRSAERSTGCHP